MVANTQTLVRYLMRAAGVISGVYRMLFNDSEQCVFWNRNYEATDAG
jgi:hypothetical protein